MSEKKVTDKLEVLVCNAPVDGKVDIYIPVYLNVNYGYRQRRVTKEEAMEIAEEYKNKDFDTTDGGHCVGDNAFIFPRYIHPIARPIERIDEPEGDATPVSFTLDDIAEGRSASQVRTKQRLKVVSKDSQD
ncbi:MAG: hypothetical protein OXH57_12730 [Ekhidna sp.]|nr:hypothetical protein [Ekhidna sp.]